MRVHALITLLPGGPEASASPYLRVTQPASPRPVGVVLRWRREEDPVSATQITPVRFGDLWPLLGGMGGFVLLRAINDRPGLLRVTGGGRACDPQRWDPLGRPATGEDTVPVPLGVPVLMATSPGSARRGMFHRDGPPPTEPLRAALRAAHMPGEVLEDGGGPDLQGVPVGGDLCPHSTRGGRRAYTLCTNGRVEYGTEVGGIGADLRVVLPEARVEMVYPPIGQEEGRYCPQGCPITPDLAVVQGATWTLLLEERLRDMGGRARSVVRAVLSPTITWGERRDAARALQEFMT